MRADSPTLADHRKFLPILDAAERPNSNLEPSLASLRNDQEIFSNIPDGDEQTSYNDEVDGDLHKNDRSASPRNYDDSEAPKRSHSSKCWPFEYSSLEELCAIRAGAILSGQRSPVSRANKYQRRVTPCRCSSLTRIMAWTQEKRKFFFIFVLQYAL